MVFARLLLELRTKQPHAAKHLSYPAKAPQRNLRAQVQAKDFVRDGVSGPAHTLYSFDVFRAKVTKKRHAEIGGRSKPHSCS